MGIWNGFQRLDITFEGREAILVIPREENKTDKWLFKMEYWDAFPNLEIELPRRFWAGEGRISGGI